MPAQVFVGSIDPDGTRTYLNKGQGRKYFAKRYSISLYSDDRGKTWTPSSAAAKMPCKRPRRMAYLLACGFL